MSIYLSEADLAKVRSKLEIYNLKTDDGLVEHEIHHYIHETSSNAASDNPIVFFVHGFGEHVAMMEDFIFQLQQVKNLDCIVYNHRGHGEKFIQPSRVCSMDFDLVTRDLLQVAEFVTQKFRSRRVYLFGNSMGGAIILNTALRHTSRFCELGLKGVVFENPYVQIHSKQANWLLKGFIHLLGRVLPSMVVPKSLDTNGVSHDAEYCQTLMTDPLYQHSITFGTAKNLLDQTYWIYSNLQNWPKEVPYNLHLATADVVVDHNAGKEFSYKTSSYHRSNLVYYYEGARHALKAETDEFKSPFVSNVCSFLQ